MWNNPKERGRSSDANQNRGNGGGGPNSGERRHSNVWVGQYDYGGRRESCPMLASKWQELVQGEERRAAAFMLKGNLGFKHLSLLIYIKKLT
jgi:hypothetical protein